MRYIRTKDGRIIDTSTYLDKCFVKEQQGGECKWEKFGLGCGNCRYNELKKVEIIKQADTIEELCDEFVLVAPYRFKKPRTGRELDKDFEDMIYFYTDKDDVIYGAIWTNKGLIYVAKMNEKGEFELL